MPAARPTKAAAANVFAALIEAGQTITGVQICADGSMLIHTQPIATKASPAQSEPKRWANGG